MKKEFSFAQFTVCLFTLFTLFSVTAFAQVKHIAVIETSIDDESGADKEISAVELREITTEIRRIAVNTLPRNRFNVMTTETVLAMGEAVLAECAEENCVIALGNTIGADYIVRGIISRLRHNFSLSIELFETEYGMLVASAPSVRTANFDELLEKGTLACAEMYKSFLGATEQQTTSPQTAIVPMPVPMQTPTLASAYTLTINRDPAVGGSVTVNDVLTRGATTHNTGDTVTVIAASNHDYMFTGWSGASRSTNHKITFVVNENLTLTANFQPGHTLAINRNPTAGGAVTVNGAAAADTTTHNVGARVTVVATANSEHIFSNWSGASSSARRKIKLTMSDDMELTANFLPKFGFGHTRLGLRGAYNLSNAHIIVFTKKFNSSMGTETSTFRSYFGRGFELGLVTNTKLSPLWSFNSGANLIYRTPGNVNYYDYSRSA